MKILFKITSLAILFTNLNSYQYCIVISAIFKDEAPYFREWIEYHKMLGVEHFRLYNNDSTDNYLNVLAPYIEQGDVTLIDWPSSTNDLKDWCSLTQWPACVDAITHLAGVTKWLAIIDIDEFILPLEDPDLPTFLKEYEEYPGVVLNWQCFGTSFVEEIPEGNLMIETLTQKAEDYSLWNLPVKSIVRPEYVNVKKMAWSPHTMNYIKNGPAVFPDKTRRKEVLDHSQWQIKTDKAIINHYVHRTEKYFREKKLPKKDRMENQKFSKNTNIVQWYLDCNMEEDTKIFRFIPDLKERLSFYK